MTGPRFVRTFVVGLFTTALVYAPLHVWAFYYQLGAPTPAEYWLRSVEIAKLHAAERASGRKIVFLSGSNTLFGVDSASVERALGRPVVNLATHGGFPLGHLLDYAKPVLRSGDTVVLPLEIGYYFMTPRIDTWLINQTMTWRGDWLAHQPLLERARFVLAVPARRVWTGAAYQLWSARVLASHPQRRLPDSGAVIREVETGWLTRDYERRPFAYSVWNLDPHGDLVGAVGNRIAPDSGRHLSRPDSASRVRFAFDYKEPQWTILRNFAHFCRDRDIRVVMACPILAREWHEHMDIDDLFRGIRQGVRNIGLDFVDTPESSMFETRHLFNHPYHLNAEGKSLRTERLIRALVAAGI